MDASNKKSLLQADSTPQPVSLKEAFWYWLKLGFISFGGPAGQISIMHHDLAKAVKNALDAQINAKHLVDSDENWLNKILQKTVGVTTPNFLPSYCLSPETRLKKSGEFS